MKKILLLLTFSFCLSTFTFSQQYGWIDISANIPGSPDLSDVFFISDDEGWITSSSQAEIYHTTDGGETFEVQTALNTCNAIWMLNVNEGYAGGASGFIYKTTNGGENWNFHGTAVSNITDISFPPNGDTGYCCGINGNIWSIDNIGVTKMTNNINGDLSSICFPTNSEEGWVCGGSVILTYFDGIWGGAPNGYPSGGYNAIYMVDSLNGWAAGDNGAIIHTSDGHNWVTQQTNPAYILADVFFVNTREGWVVGSGGGIFHTINSGTIWDIEGVELSSSILRGVHFTSPTNGYVVGNDKTLLKYTELITEVETGRELEALKLKIYPNPVSKKLTIDLPESSNSYQLKMVNSTGQIIVLKESFSGNEINVSGLTTGMYFIMLQNRKEIYTARFVKN